MEMAELKVKHMETWDECSSLGFSRDSLVDFFVFLEGKCFLFFRCWLVLLIVVCLDMLVLVLFVYFLSFLHIILNGCWMFSSFVRSVFLGVVFCFAVSHVDSGTAQFYKDLITLSVTWQQQLYVHLIWVWVIKGYLKNPGLAFQET